MDLVTLFLAILVTLVVYVVLRWKTEDRVTKYVNKIPGPLSLPIIGTTLEIALASRVDGYKVFTDLLRSYGTIFRTWMGSIPAVELMTPEHVELILNNSVQITKSKNYNMLRPWLGDGLLTSSGSKWHLHRKLITPTFHFKILESFMESFVEKSQLLSKLLKEKADGEVFDIHPYITHCALDIICETAMGVEMNAMSLRDNKYAKAVFGMSEIIVERMLKPWLLVDFIFRRTKYGKDYQNYMDILHGFTDKVIEDRKKTLSSKSPGVQKESDELIGRKKRMAFLDLLLEASEDGKVLTNADIREEVDTFMFEGHDTTTAGISWCLFLLGSRPEIQEQVYQEIENVFQGEEDKVLTINDLAELKLLERCIKEALRLYPSVPSIGRLLTQDVMIDNYLVPAGCGASVHIFMLHRNEKHFPDPERFDPDRFLPENSKNRHPYAYVPFSAGPRNCIGQKFAMYEEKTMLAYIFRNFRVKSVDTEETITPVMELVLKPLNGVRVTLEPRH